MSWRPLVWMVLSFLLLAGQVEAACTGSSPTRTAATASRAEVDACLTAAVDGDTILVPAGTQTWSSPLPLPATKDVSVIGATTVSCTGTPVTCSASNQTVLTCQGGAFCFQFHLARTHRVSGFTFTLDGGFVTTGNQDVTKHFRLDHNHFLGTDSFTQLWFAGDSNAVHPQGVIDNNLVEDTAFRPIGTTHQWDDSCSTCQHQLWTQVIPLGGSESRVFIEHNEFRHDLAGVQSSDSNYGGRYVYRFNNATSGFHNSEVHGMQGENRGSQLTEIYHNAFTSPEASGTGGTTNFRGGTGVIFLNTQSFDFAYGISLTIDRSEYDESAGNFGTVKECGAGGPDGNSPAGVDQQTGGQNGWRCRDQIGTGSDAVLWTTTASGPPFGAWNQVVKPLYIWGNTTGGSPMAIDINTQGDIENKIVVSREFYCDAGTSIGACNNGVRLGTLSARPSTCTTGMAYWATDEGEWNSLSAGADGRLYLCTSTDTWTLSYTPAPYPHPWTGAAAPPDPEPIPLILRLIR